MTACHSEPFALCAVISCFVCRDQLYCVPRRRMTFSRRVKLRPQALPEICERKSTRFGVRSNAKQFFEFAA